MSSEPTSQRCKLFGEDIVFSGTGEMSQWLRVLIAILDDLSLSLSTCVGLLTAACNPRGS